MMANDTAFLRYIASQNRWLSHRAFPHGGMYIIRNDLERFNKVTSQFLLEQQVHTYE